MKNSLGIFSILLVFIIISPVLYGMESSGNQPPRRSWFKRHFCCCCSGEESAAQYRVTPLPTSASQSQETVTGVESAPSIEISPAVSVDAAPLPCLATVVTNPAVIGSGSLLTVVDPLRNTPASSVVPESREGLCVASSSNNPRGMVRCRSDFDGYAGESRLHDAILRGNDEQVLLILCDEELRNIYLNMKDLWGRTPLHLAFLKKDLLLARELVRWGAKVNIRENDGRTVLHYAVEAEDEEMVIFLLNETEIDITITDRWGLQAEGLVRRGTAMENLFVEYHECLRRLHEDPASAASASS